MKNKTLENEKDLERDKTIKPRTLEYQQNVNFANGPIVGYPKNFKSNEDIIPKSKWHGFQIIRINRKKFGGSGITPSYFSALLKYSSPPQLRYPQLSYFRSNAILNWVPKNSS